MTCTTKSKGKSILGYPLMLSAWTGAFEGLSSDTASLREMDFIGFTVLYRVAPQFPKSAHTPLFVTLDPFAWNTTKQPRERQYKPRFIRCTGSFPVCSSPVGRLKLPSLSLRQGRDPPPGLRAHVECENDAPIIEGEEEKNQEGEETWGNRNHAPACVGNQAGTAPARFPSAWSSKDLSY